MDRSKFIEDIDKLLQLTEEEKAEFNSCFYTDAVDLAKLKAFRDKISLRIKQQRDSSSDVTHLSTLYDDLEVIISFEEGFQNEVTHLPT